MRMLKGVKADYSSLYYFAYQGLIYRKVKPQAPSVYRNLKLEDLLVDVLKEDL